MIKQTLIKLMTLLALSFVWTACGGGGSSTPDDNGITAASDATAKGKGGIEPCTGTDKGFAKATEIEVGKAIKGIENNPNIRLWHLDNGTRKACVVRGSVEVTKI